jgi:hypothetical protein
LRPELKGASSKETAENVKAAKQRGEDVYVAKEEIQIPGSLEEAQALFRLMKGLLEKSKCMHSEYCKKLEEQLPEVLSKAEKHIREAFSRFGNTMRSVEISWAGLKADDRDAASLQQIWFPIPAEAIYMPESRINKIKLSFPWGEEDKMLQFALVNNKDKNLYSLCYWRLMQDEMLHLQLMQANAMYKALASQQTNLKSLSFFIAWVMNIMLVLTLEWDAKDNIRPTFKPKLAEKIVSGLGVTQILCTTFILGFLVVNKAPLVYTRLKRAAENAVAEKSRNTKKRQVRSMRQRFSHEWKILVSDFSFLIKICVLSVTACLISAIVYGEVWALLLYSICGFIGVGFTVGLRQQLDNNLNIMYLMFTVVYDCLTNFEIFFYTIYTVISLLGQLDSYWWFSLHLLDIMMRAPAIQNVAYAVYKPREPLLLTFLLTFIFVYIFTIFGFYYIHDDFYNEESAQNECQTMVKCFGTFMRNGLIFGGGIGDYMAGELGQVPNHNNEEKFVGRALYDLLFFIIVIVLLLNIVFGIIIDTFASLRESQGEQKEQMTQKCAVCSITKDEIEVLFAKKNKRDGFEMHIKEEHNMWNYVFYIMYVSSVDVTDLSGVESYVFDQLGTTPDLGWIPLRMALCQDDEH